MFKGLHHTAVTCSDYKKSKEFYVEKLGLEVAAENYREDKKSYKLDLKVNGKYQIELFSFPNPPKRVSKPEACGLRHIAFEVEDIEESLKKLIKAGIECEPIRIDEYTGKKFTFFQDPDGLPLEIYEM